MLRATRSVLRWATMHNAWGLSQILPVDENHLPVWTESDIGALVMYAGTCKHTGSGEHGSSSLFKNVGRKKRRRTNSVNTFLQAMIFATIIRSCQYPVYFQPVCPQHADSLVFGEKNSFEKKKKKIKPDHSLNFMYNDASCSICLSCGPRYHKERDTKGQRRSNANRKFMLHHHICCCVAAFSCLPRPNFKSNLVHLLNSTWAQIGRQRVNAFRHANVVKMTCQSANWAPEWGRKGIQVTLSVAWFVDVRLAGFSISKAADQLGFLSTTSRD